MNTVRKWSKFRISSVRRGGTYTNHLALRMGAAKLLLSLVYGIIRLLSLDFILKTSTRFVFGLALNSEGKYLLFTFKEKNAKLLSFKMLLIEERICSSPVSFLYTKYLSFSKQCSSALETGDRFVVADLKHISFPISIFLIYFNLKENKLLFLFMCLNQSQNWSPLFVRNIEK